jgi:hypothetical protein
MTKDGWVTDDLVTQEAKMILITGSRKGTCPKCKRTRLLLDYREWPEGEEKSECLFHFVWTIRKEFDIHWYSYLHLMEEKNEREGVRPPG